MKLEEKNEDILEAAQPFFFKGTGERGALLIHGFSGSPVSLRRLGKFLVQKGISAYGVRLAGHGTTLENFAQSDYRDWQESARLGFLKLKENYQKVYIIGSSFGGNLAFNLSLCYPSAVKKIVTIGTPISIRSHHINRIIIPKIKYFKKYHKKSWLVKLKNNSIKKEASAKKIPLGSINQFLKFIEEFTKKELPKVTVPTLIVHSKKDIIIPIRSARYIYENIGSREKELVWLEKSYHDPLMDYPKDDLLERIYQFLINE